MAGFNLQQAGAVSGVASAISSIFAGQVAATGFELQAYTAKIQAESRELTRGVKTRALKVQAQQARNAAKMVSLSLKEKYNNVASNQAITFAAQGRSTASGSVQNLMRADQERLQWDLDYAEASGDYQAAGIEAEAIMPAEVVNTGGFDTAAKLARSGGVQKGLLQLGKTATDFKRIK